MQDRKPSARAVGAANDSRRDFLKVSGTALAAGGLTALGTARSAYAAGNDVLKIGLVGCGGRGTGAALQALKADKGTRLVAMGDTFEDQLESSLANLKKSSEADRVQVDQEHRFVGFDAFKKVIDAVDVVLLATPPHFRPEHLKYAVDAGKHIFAEKPIAVDAAGVRSVLETAQQAKAKKLFIVSGLCWRYETGMQEVIQQVHDGRIGDIVALETTRYGNGAGRQYPRKPGMGEMEYQLRNWYFQTWLSGDHIVEQFIHELDKLAWVMKDEPPVKCVAAGGRQVRTSSEFGHIYDHFNVNYEYANGVKLYAGARHWDGCASDRTDLVHGTQGRANLMKYEITGANPWRRRERMTVMHQLEHDAFFAALRKGGYINNGDYMAKSTLMAIMGRMAAYTGKEVSWEQALNSEEILGPTEYGWDVSIPEYNVAHPGVTPLV